MRKVIMALLTCAIMTLPLGVVSAPSAHANVNFYFCDGNGAGSCMSLTPGGCDTCDYAPLYAIGESAGAWTWLANYGPNVGSTSYYTFTDPYIENALAGQPTISFLLYADTKNCAANSSGSGVVRYSPLGCSFSKAELWVLDPQTGWLVNLGRSNDQDNWEILCNPGGGGQLIVTTRDACSTYHEQWAVS